MWKPRSTVVDDEGRPRHIAASLLTLRRFGSRKWNRRYVFVDHHYLCYGKEEGRYSKRIPFEVIQSAALETEVEAMRRLSAPKAYAAFGWRLTTMSRRILFCAESSEVAELWVDYFTALVQEMANVPPVFSTLSLDSSPYTLPGPGTLAEMTARLGNSFLPSPSPQEEERNVAVLGGTSTESPGIRTPVQESLGVDHSPQNENSPSPVAVNGDVVSLLPTGTQQTALAASECETRVGDGAEREGMGTAENDLAMSSDDMDDDDSDSEAENREENEEQGTRGESRPTQDSAVEPSRAAPSPDQLYAQLLLPIAAQPHSHIDYRLPVLESYFKSGDNASSVRFSRSVEKIGKRGNTQPRELVLTIRNLYLFSKPRIGSGFKVRCIDAHGITGVMESTTEKTLVAVLVPSFHDILLRIVPQRSCIVATLVEVKRQLMAHLFSVHRNLHTQHRFLFLHSASVAQHIRRREAEPHPPLRSLSGDQMHAAECPPLLPIFAENADEAVYWSSVVRLVPANHQPQLNAILLTEGSLYVLSDNLHSVVRRVPLRDVLRLQYDADAQSILLRCRELDLLFNMQSSVEFDTFRRVLLIAMGDVLGLTLRQNPSKQLYSHAKQLLHSGQNSSVTDRHRTFGNHSRSFLWNRKRGTTWIANLHAKEAKGLLELLSPEESGFGDNGGGDNTAATQNHHSISGAFTSRQAIRLFCAQFRFVEEIILDYDDAVRLLEQFEKLRSRFSDSAAPSHRNSPAPVPNSTLGEIFFYTPCRLLSARECGTVAKPSALSMDEAALLAMGSPRIACISLEGIAFLRDTLLRAPGTAVVGTKSVAFRSDSVMLNAVQGASALGTVSKSDVLEMVPWSSIAAVVRCHITTDAFVAILTNCSHESDYMFHVGGTEAMLDVVVAAVGAYARYRQSALPNAMLLPIYTTPRAHNAAVTMKRTVYDPFPTVALRYTPSSFLSDRLRMAFIPDIADALRRFGDNAVYFSGVLWRVRSATLRKYNGRLEVDPMQHMCQRNNNLYKSVVLLITNAAVYYCTKGGFEVVRRTRLRDLKSICVHADDPDTILVSVPSEYDMYFRIEGRGPELVARLQEAYVEWTNYDLYLPHEPAGSHSMSDYGLPVFTQSRVAANGNLAKLPTFNSLHASRSAAECRDDTQRWHLERMRYAIKAYEQVTAAASSDRSVASKSPAARRSSWKRWSQLMSQRQSLLRFVQRRCFRFGITGEDFMEMERAQVLLHQYEEMVQTAKQLVASVHCGNAEEYKMSLSRAVMMPQLRHLVVEVSAAFEYASRCKQCFTSILVELQTFRNDRQGVCSLADLESVLVARLQEAKRLGLDAITERQLCIMMQWLTHRAQLHRVLGDVQKRSSVLVQPNNQLLVRSAAREVGLTFSEDTWFPPLGDSGRCLSSVRSASMALQAALQQGQRTVVGYAIQYARHVLQECLPPGLQGSLLSTKNRHEVGNGDDLVKSLAALADAAEKEYVGYAQYVSVEREVLALVAMRQLHQRRQSWTNEVVVELQRQCKGLCQRIPDDCQLCKRLRSLIDTESALLAASQYRLACLRLREEDAQSTYAAELQRRERATRRDAQQQECHEQNLQRHLWEGEMATWSVQVDRLTAKLSAISEDAGEEVEELLHLELRRCAHVRRLIEEAMAQRATGLPSGEVGSPTHDGRAAFATINDARATELLEKLSRATEKAQVALSSCSSNRVALSATPTTASLKVTEFIPESTGVTDISLPPLPPPPPRPSLQLPPELIELIDAQDTEGLASYMESRNGAADVSADMVREVRGRWRAVCRRRRWKAALYKGLHTAAAQRSRDLLALQLRAADAISYQDEVVQLAARLVKAMQPGEELSTEADKDKSKGEGGEDVSALKDNPDCSCHRLSASIAQELSSAVPSHTEEGIIGPPTVFSQFCNTVRLLLTYELNRVVLTSKPPSAATYALLVTPSNPFCRPLLTTGAAVLRYYLVLRDPAEGCGRSAWDLMQQASNLAADERYPAPLLQAAVQDFQQLYHPRGDSEDSRQRTDTVLIAMLLFTHRLRGVINDAAKQARQEVLGEEVTNATPLKELLTVSEVLDQVQWAFESVQAFAVASLFPTSRQSSQLMDAPAKTEVGKDMTLPSVSTKRNQQSPLESSDRRPVSGASGGDAAPLSLTSSVRKSQSAEAARLLQEAVRAIGTYLSNCLGSQTGEMASPHHEPVAIASFFDERQHPAIGALVDRVVLPALVYVLSCGLAPQQEQTGHLALWDVVVELNLQWRQNACSLAEVELQSVVELVAGMTTGDGRRTRAAALQRLSKKQLLALRSRLLLRECLNRQLLYTLVCVLFGSHDAEEERAAEAEMAMAGAVERGRLQRRHAWNYSVLYPVTDESASELRILLQKMSRLPFVLVIDKELR